MIAQFRVLFYILSFGSTLAYAQLERPFPDGCGNPFVQDGIFGEFYERTIEVAVVESGSVTNNHVNLFAVNKLRKYLASRYPNPADGEAIDKHIRAQLCSYAQEHQGLSSANAQLHRHLASISSKLLRDVKRLSAEIDEKEKARQRALAKFESRMGLIERAERLAEKEVSSFLR